MLGEPEAGNAGVKRLIDDRGKGPVDMAIMLIAVLMRQPY